MRVMNAAAALVITIVLASLAGFGMPEFSSAAYTAATTNPGNTVSAAADWTPPTVTVQDPGPAVRDTVGVNAFAKDNESGVKDVTIQYRPAGAAAWVALCTTVTAPYACSWNTKAVADGPYDLRALATDTAGYSAVSASVRTTVANNLSVVLSAPGDVVRGTVNLTTTLTGAGTGSYTVRVEYSAPGANSWTAICPSIAAPYNCVWDTTATRYPDDYYDLRSVVVSGAPVPGPVSAVVSDVLVDNTLPVVTMTDPGSPLSGTRTFSATATDAESGVVSVSLQYAVNGTTAYKDLCTVSAAPFSCRVDTTALANGTYAFRAVAVDAAGNLAVSPVLNRVVDNTVSSISVEDPGAYLTGNVQLTANAASRSGVGSVRIQKAPAGTTTWTTLCTFSAAPYSCTWNTVPETGGLYDLRAVLIDGSGKETVSALVASRRVDNSPLRGADIQSVNGSGTAGKLDAGDTIAFTYSEQINLATVTPGWTGTALPVSLRLRDGNILGLGNTGDTVDIQRTGSVVNLGSVNLRQDYIKNNKAAIFNSTLTAGTVTINGIVRTTVTVTLGTLSSGNGNFLRGGNTGAHMLWMPSASVTGLNANSCSAAPVTETGVLDRDF